MNENIPGWRWTPPPEVLANLNAATALAKANTGLLDFTRRIASVYQPQFDQMAEIAATPFRGFAVQLGENMANMAKSALGLAVEQQRLTIKLTMRPLFESTVFEYMRNVTLPAQEMMARAVEMIRDLDPPNWPAEANWSDMFRLIEETGWPLTYVPRAEVIIALLKADPAEREAVLLAHDVEIVADCRVCLDEIIEPETEHLVAALVQAVDAFDAGLVIPAQTTVASVLSDVLGRELRLSFTEAKRQLAENPGEMPMAYLRFWLVASALPATLRRFDCERGDEVPDRFNRHAAAHTVDPRQHTRLNALVGLMLTAGLVREIATRQASDEDRRDEAAS